MSEPLIQGRTRTRVLKRIVFDGVVMVLTSVVVMAILGAILLPALAKSKAEAQNTRCKNYLKQIGVASIGIYANKTGSLPPAGGNEFFQVLFASNTLTDPTVYICPSDKSGSNSAYFGLGAFGAANTSYWGRKTPYGEFESKEPLAADESIAHHVANINALYQDGHVVSVPLGDGITDPLSTPPFAGTLGD